MGELVPCLGEEAEQDPYRSGRLVWVCSELAQAVGQLRELVRGFFVLPPFDPGRYVGS